VYSILLLFFGCSNTSNNLVNNLNFDKFPDTIKKVKDSIVLLSVHPNDNPENNPQLGGLCTGIIIDDIGHVITNFHCVYKQNYIRLYYHNKNEWRGRKVKIIGVDPLADLALIKIIEKNKSFLYLNFVDEPENIKPGTDVFAMGHPMGMVWTVTKGIVSSNNRHARHPFIKAIQTDAAINKGNSGGPLLNMKGELIGINSLILSKNSQNAGIGLAIRSDIVKKSIESMIDNGKVDRPAVGVMIMGLTNEKSRKNILKEFPDVNPDNIPNIFGLLIRPGDDIPKGLKAFDFIIGVNKNIINTGTDFSNELIKYKVGDNVTLTIIRERWILVVDVSLKVLSIPVERMYPAKPSMTTNPEKKLEEKEAPE
jgi:S1-C subfamily serine protease